MRIRQAQIIQRLISGTLFFIFSPVIAAGFAFLLFARIFSAFLDLANYLNEIAGHQLLIHSREYKDGLITIDNDQYGTALYGWVRKGGES